MSLVLRWSLAIAAIVVSGQNGGQSDEQQIQGIWKIAKVKRNGEFISEGIANKGRYIFVKDKWLDISLQKIVNECRFSLAPTKNPKEINLQLPDTTPVFGIYSIKDDQLTLCIAQKGVERPKEFDAADQSKHTLLILQREK